MAYVHINGRQVAEAQATVPADDRGFRFGDGLFETVPVHDGLPYLWDYHRERLAGGLAALGIPYETQDLLPAALTLIAANKVTRGLLRIQISRGAGSSGYLPTPGITPTLIMQTLPLPAPILQPVQLWLSIREKISPKALPTQFKLAQGLASTLARLEAQEHDCFDALQLAADGAVSEASSANIFWLKGGTLHTPSLDCGTLAGVTRRRIIELSPYPMKEGRFFMEDLAQADAVIISNASRGAVAVDRLAPHPGHWESLALAEEINNLRNNDIIKSMHGLRESLART